MAKKVKNTFDFMKLFAALYFEDSSFVNLQLLLCATVNVNISRVRTPV